MSTIPPEVVRFLPRPLRAYFEAMEKPAQPVPLAAHESAVAGWLRGDAVRMASLTNLLTARYDQREALPLPSTELDLAYVASAQRELRDILKWLRELHDAPVSSGSIEEQ